MEAAVWLTGQILPTAVRRSLLSGRLPALVPKLRKVRAGPIRDKLAAAHASTDQRLLSNCTRQVLLPVAGAERWPSNGPDCGISGVK